MTPEEFRVVPGTMGKMRASRAGVIVGPRGPIKPEVLAAGYWRFNYYVGGGAALAKTRKMLWHRAVLSAWVEGEGQVDHIDGDKSNNTLSNLEWVTQSENMQRAEALGLHNGRRKILDTTRV